MSGFLVQCPALKQRGPGQTKRPSLVFSRIRSGVENAGKWASGGHVLRWDQAALPHQRKTPEKGRSILTLSPQHVWEAVGCSAEWAFPRWWTPPMGSEGSAPTDLCPICLPCRCGLTSQTSSWWDSEITRSVPRARMWKTQFVGVSTKETFAFAGHQSRRHPEVQHRRGAQLESLRRAARQRCAPLFRPLTSDPASASFLKYWRFDPRS